VSSDRRPRILCVDDERNVLEGLTRALRAQFQVETAQGGVLALDLLRKDETFAVVVSDLRMPEMDGVTFLRNARQIAPDTVRVLLTGHGDMDSAMAAVNQGNIFRFLTKPCPTDQLVRTLNACVEQHELIVSEKILLEQTLRGSIRALTEILSLTNPLAFGRATRICKSVCDMAERFGAQELWTIEVAAMLSQVGYVALPPKTLEKVYHGQPISDADQSMLERVPAFTEQLLANIPRLEKVREILRYQNRQFNGGNDLSDRIIGDAIPWGARALKIALDLDLLESESSSIGHPFDVMRGRKGWYDPEILEGFAELRGSGVREVNIRELSMREIDVGMIFSEDVKSAKGLLLIARGQEVTHSLLERVRNFSPELGIAEPIRMIVRESVSQEVQPVPVTK
jgi:response regulator RpfG family c-di-GMP phosphodiesterase